MSTMFKKRNRKNIRTRKANNEEEDKNDTEEPAISIIPHPPTLSKQVAHHSAAAIKPSGCVLSFEDELNDNDAFKLKKTKVSERMAKHKEREKVQAEKNRKFKEVEAIRTAMEAEDSDDDNDEGVVSINDHLQSGIVPDATMIHAIRKKREKARELGVSSVDYLPLEKDGKKGYGTVKGKSRLIREDDNDISDEDNDDRVMNFVTTNEPGRQLQVLASLENIGSESEDEETRKWEEEQINKGIKASNQLEDRPSSDLHYQSVTMDTITQSFVYGSSYYHGINDGGVVLQQQQHQPVIPEKLVPISLETLKSKLTNRLEELKDINGRHCQQIEQITQDIIIAHEAINKVDTNYPSMEGQYAFFQQMRSYVRDLLSCLAIKYPHIKALDGQITDILGKKAKLLIERRRDDIIDEADECASNGKTINIGSEVEARQRRSVEREGRRRRRKEKRQREGIITEHNEGMSTDEELLETDRLKYISDTDLINERLKDVFSDVMDDFYQLHVIRTRFEQWKLSYPDTYNQAFVTMCLPRLFAPFVTLQLINWNPLEPSSPSLESMKWFQELMFYGHEEGETPDINDDDNYLIPLIINKSVIPKLTSIIDSLWDPLSTKQTINLIRTVNEILNEYCIDHTPQQDELLLVVNKRLQETINNDVFIPLMSSIQLQNNSTRDFVFYQRQFWSAIKLLSNILLWRDILPRAVIQQLVLDGLISRYILLSLQNSPVDKLTVKKTETLFTLLPSVWFEERIVSKLRPLQGLKRYLSNLLETLQRDGMGHNEHMKKINRSLEERIQVIRNIF